jgi:hypothetical protein
MGGHSPRGGSSRDPNYQSIGPTTLEGLPVPGNQVVHTMPTEQIVNLMLIQPEFLIEISLLRIIRFSHHRNNGFAADSSGYVVAIPATPHTRPTFQSARAAKEALRAGIWEWGQAVAFVRVWASDTIPQ